MPAGSWVQLAVQANEAAQVAQKAGNPLQPVTETTGSWVAAAMPVYLRGGYGLVGSVILARSTTSLNRDIVELWVILGTIAVVAMLGATLLAFGLARWVSRPLAGLDSAAGRLADGDLESRAVVDSGPPELRRLATTFNTMAGRLEALVDGLLAVARGRTWYRCRPRWTWPRWPGSGSWPGIRWPTTAASCSRPCPGRQCWPG